LTSYGNGPLTRPQIESHPKRLDIEHTFVVK
jgi:hypothetical protein